MEEKIWKIGFIVNPIAGMGGIVGLKGTELGAQPVVPQKPKIVLKTLLQLKKQLKLITYPTKWVKMRQLALVSHL